MRFLLGNNILIVDKLAVDKLQPGLKLFKTIGVSKDHVTPRNVYILAASERFRENQVLNSHGG